MGDGLARGVGFQLGDGCGRVDPPEIEVEDDQRRGGVSQRGGQRQGRVCDRDHIAVRLERFLDANREKEIPHDRNDPPFRPAVHRLSSANTGLMPDLEIRL